ncbi:RNA 2',3'-cyclic phosphodiesterase [Streptomyces sp. NBC_00237]|uniref:RNA 2',3'-cyclic phosphodiesterase n=1 Tax=Streptomyces sp. NBC_00237 TaxID=2975687 RepID=UPI0022578583|nr:RNA 2',3'-cyclic phosphodiesterase [Streptomyces sp. NBC_00237]MCX5205212.1 RNA 2',3'-cyclic phosphodiesterase [Streptomyces sp. NBC_00237]
MSAVPPVSAVPSESGRSEPTTRVFVALAPPDPAKDELARALGPAYAAYPRMRWNRIEDWHLTLAFLGEQPVSAVPLLGPPLADLAASRSPLSFALTGGGHFDERVLWSGIEGDLDALQLLAGEVRALVKGCGVAFEERRLRPHLTLARARRDDPRAAAEAAATLANFAGRRWRAARLHLVASNVGRGPGPIRYRDVESWPFTGPGSGTG